MVARAKDCRISAAERGSGSVPRAVASVDPVNSSLWDPRSLPLAVLIRLPSFWFELDHNAPQRRVSDILHRVDHGRIESGSVGHNLSDNLRLSFRQLLKAGPVELDHNALAVAVARARVTYSQPLFKDKEQLAGVGHGDLFGRNDTKRAFYLV